MLASAQTARTVGEKSMAYRTRTGALDSYDKGVIELNDDLRQYAFSNIF